MYDISRKLYRLTDLYIAQDIKRADYLSSRRALVLEKKSVEERAMLLERNTGYWLEPMREWIKDASKLPEAAKSKDLSSKKSSLRKIFGSNLILRNKEIQENPMNQWATLRVARKKFSENELSFILAAGLGFEPR